MGHESDLVAVEKGGLDRRTLIKRAAAAGAIAWTAPIIIDSFASPAAAITGPQGCSQACFNQSCGFNQTSLCNFTDCVSGSNAQSAACLQITGACDEGGNTTATVLAGCACNITGYNYNDPGGTCHFVSVAPAKTITFDIDDAHTGVNQICIKLECG